MYVRLHSAGAWGRIKKLTKSSKSRRVLAAVSFLGRGATTQFPLKSGDLLILRFDQTTVRSGLVDPKEVGKYLKKGVEVHAVRNLHSKVFVVGNKALVGSTNISVNSERHLVEAICESDEPQFVESCRNFVLGLRSDEITPEYAKSLEPQFKPSKLRSGSKKREKSIRISTSDMAVVKLDPINYDAVDQVIEKEGGIKAKDFLKNKQKYVVDEFRWEGEFPSFMKPGIRVLEITRVGAGRYSVASPARLLYVKKYKSARNAERRMVFLEKRRHTKEIAFSALVRRLPSAAKLKRYVGMIQDRNLAFGIGAIWGIH
jgi:hypothetical protein